MARLGGAGHGEARHGFYKIRYRAAWHGWVRHGLVRQGLVRQGKVRQGF